MYGKIESEYFEKYAVASPPSRDYYGIKVLREEVILYLWRISHGPHRTPIVRSADFPDFHLDKTLQDDIGRGFGERILQHVRNIASGKRKSLLTLPKSLLFRLCRYLQYTDIVNLSSVSYVAHEIFSDNSLWEALYRRYKNSRITKVERDYGMAYGWKQLLKEQHAQSLIADKQGLRPVPMPGTLKWQSEIKANNRSTKMTPQASISMLSARPKKSQDGHEKNLVSNVTKRPFDVRATSSTTTFSYSRSQISEKKTIKPKSVGTLGERSLKSSKDQPPLLKPELRREREKISVENVNCTESKSLLRSTGVQKPSGNLARKNSTPSRLNLALENKSKPALIKPTTSRNVVGVKNESGPGRLMPNDRTKCQPSTKPKSKKVGPSKSTILNTDKAVFSDIAAIQNDNFDLAHLIEASMKNIRSPRSIFDYDFSYLEQQTPAAGDSKSVHDSSSKTDGVKNRKVTRPRMALDRLSEKSEPVTAKSIDSSSNDAKPEKRNAIGKTVNGELERMKSSLATDFTGSERQGEKAVDRFSDIFDKFSSSPMNDYEIKMDSPSTPFVSQQNAFKVTGTDGISKKQADMRSKYLKYMSKFKEVDSQKNNTEGGKEYHGTKK